MNESDSNYSGMQRNQHEEFDQKKNKKPLWRKILLWILIVIVVLIAFGASLFTYYAASAPQIPYSALSSDTSTTIYGSNGKVVSRLGAQNREYVHQKQIPKTLTDAVVSIEDRHFYKEGGVDPVRIVEAAFSNLIGRDGLQGGSTLTQQLVKLSVFSTKASDQTLKRKAQEAWLAVKINHDYSKNQILEFYINKVYMGNNTYGMQTASEHYFNKPLNKLSLAQTALLAGMPQAPTEYDPYKNPKLATNRRNQVLNAMAKNKVISREDAQEAIDTPVTQGLDKNHQDAMANPEIKNEKYADPYIKQVVQELSAKGYKMNTGLKVYTNLNMKNQKQMYQLANSANSPVQFPNNQFQIGATLVNSNNGKVTSMIGSRKSNVQFGLNRAVQTDRSAGSTTKPLMDYGPAMEYLQYPTYQPLQDTPYTYAGTNIQLEDFDHRHEGLITMQKALIESRNIPAIRTLQAVGIPKATQFLAGLGIHSKTPYTLQNGIGIYISSEQEAAAYAAFANGGIYYKPYLINKVVTANGTIKKYNPDGHRVMSPGTAYMMTQMLKGVLTDKNGSGTAAKIPGMFEAGKTGTTQYPGNYVNSVPDMATMDSWFTGYNKNYSLSIWTGYDKQFAPGHYVTEQQTSIAQNYYKNMMSQANQGLPNTDWERPSDVVQNKRGYSFVGHPGTFSQAATDDATQTNQARNNKAVVKNQNNQRVEKKQPVRKPTPTPKKAPIKQPVKKPAAPKQTPAPKPAKPAPAAPKPAKPADNKPAAANDQ